MKRFFLKFIDPKILVTELIVAAIVGIFAILWPHLSSITESLWPILKYEIPIPVVPSLLIIISLGIFIGKVIGKSKPKFNNPKTFKITSWRALTNSSNPQNLDYQEINLNDKLLKSIKCKIVLKTDYLRFGFKLLDKDARVYGSNTILTNDFSGLFHVSKLAGSNQLTVTTYKNNKIDGKDVPAGTFLQGQDIELELRIEYDNQLDFLINQIAIYHTTIINDYRKRVILMAWGDGHDFEIEVNNIEVLTI